MNKHKELVEDIIREMRDAMNETCEYGSYCIGKYASRLEDALARNNELLWKKAFWTAGTINSIGKRNCDLFATYEDALEAHGKSKDWEMPFGQWLMKEVEK